jgi:acylphosphatase
MAKARVQVTLTGVVQGVFFRSFIKSRAGMLGLKGWVRNTPDGAVEAVFEGDEVRILEMIKECEKGPGHAFIRNVKTKWDKYTGEYNSFGIVY